MKKALIIILALLLVLTIIGGCSASKKPGQDEDLDEDSPAELAPTPQTPQSESNEDKMSDYNSPNNPAHTQAMKLAQAAEDVENVKTATVVITGSTAIVGLEIKSDITGSETDQIKEDVTNEIKKVDSSIKTVSITTDPNLITRIQKIAEGIKDGKSISSFTDELAEIVRRINPKTE